MLYDGEEFERGGKTFKVEFPYDDSGNCDAPWDREDGHGDVSDWTTRDKEPGERVLCSDGRFRRYYDFRGAVEKAKRDGWGARKFGCNGSRPDSYYRFLLRHWRKPTEGEIADAAAQEDFDYLRRWADGAWTYVGVVVTLLDEEGDDAGEDESLWGIESDAFDYLESTAYELADDILSRVKVAQDRADEASARAMEESRPDLYGL